MANITPVQLTSDGAAALTLAAATGGGDTIVNAVATSPSAASSKSGTVLVVNNGAGAPITVTLTGSGICNQGVVHNPTFAVAAGKQQHIPVPPQCINASGQVAVGYSSATTVTVGAYNH